MFASEAQLEGQLIAKLGELKYIYRAEVLGVYSGHKGR